MILLFPLLFVMVEGYPSLLVDEEDMNESGWDTVEHDNSSDKSSAALLSDLLLVLRGEMEISTTTASISANDHNEETRKHQENLMSKEDQDCKKASYSSYHSTTVVPGGKENQNLPGDKTMGATNIDGGRTEQDFDEPQRILPENTEQFTQNESESDAAEENCKPERWCHTTFSNEYQTRKEEECKETFARWVITTMDN